MDVARKLDDFSKISHVPIENPSPKCIQFRASLAVNLCLRVPLLLPFPDRAHPA
jgi:hypothetical protein